ncbi:hypothetical protein D3C73_1538080 [compost metagenome]
MDIEHFTLAQVRALVGMDQAQAVFGAVLEQLRFNDVAVIAGRALAGRFHLMLQ